MSTKSFSGQDLADLAGVEGITFRRYIRSDGTRVGRGKKYSFTAEDAELLLTGFLTGKKDADGNKMDEETAAAKANELINEEVSQAEAEEDADSDEEDTEEHTEES